MTDRSVVVCCGSGGVGKTTVSATFALAAARAGRRSCVVTVDPARRLADALGVESLPNTPSEVAGDWPGHLHALMLDSKGTFDDLVQRYARTPEQAESILANRLYQNLAGALSGTQEYMAMEKLYELVNSGEFDIVVVDTPPTRNALDLLDAPRRLTRFLENRLFRAILVPTKMSLRAVGVATQALLRTIAKVAGAEIVQDAVSFFQAFEGMEDGFRSRASAVHELLADPATAYVLVTSARPDALREAGFFAEKLAERDVAVAALVVNRIAPSFGDGGGRPAGGERTGSCRVGGQPGAAERVGGAGGVGLCGPGGGGGTGTGRPNPTLRAGRARAHRSAAGGRSPLRLKQGRHPSGRGPARRRVTEHSGQSDSVAAVQTILVASDAPTLRKDVEAVISGPDIEVRAVTSGPEVVAFVAEESPDLLIVDMQMGNMGGMAVCLELRLQESYDALGHIPVLMLLDRRPDVFLARRSDAEGWLVKPLDPLRLRRAVSGAAGRRDLCRRLVHARTRAGGRRTPAAGGTRAATLTRPRRVATHTTSLAPLR